MELELKKTCLDAYETSAELTLTQEETAETIVPDYCPDIARIIETTGRVFLHSRELRDGRGTVSGTVRVTVLYTPEGEGGIRTLEFAMPFTAESDGRGLADCAVLLAETETEFLETRMLNPRKVFTHCKLVTRLTGFQRRPLWICTDVEAGPELCIEKKQEQQHVILLTHIVEKDFTFSEQMDLSPGREGAAELLTSQVCPAVTETKIVGSKLLFKGIFTVSLLYRTADGRCCTSSGELPFSQIMEVEGVPEGAEPTVQLQLTGADLQVDGADAEGREIAVTLYLHATALVRQTQEVSILSDLYSTAYDLTYDAALLELAGCDDALAGGTLELAGGVETLCGREDELSSFEHAANSTAAQSAGANSFHTVFFTTKHFLSLWGIPLFVIRPAGTKYFIFPHVLRKFHKTQIKKRGGAASPFCAYLSRPRARSRAALWACPQ